MSARKKPKAISKLDLQDRLGDAYRVASLCRLAASALIRADVIDPDAAEGLEQLLYNHATELREIRGLLEKPEPVSAAE